RRVEPAPRPAAPAPAPFVELSGTATVLTLGAHMCKWPIGDPSSNEFSFCGRRAGESPYCVEHARVAYQPAQKGKKGGANELARALRRYI
ncbi:GcrA family cell cycle regulator, partial [Caulobacter sp. 17J65-9]|uniref:GcrA family cell cycle regulator n=1 Tax=Caulobacter sp. 17J65-9 TaxID=2709382 RepID=UPI0013C9E780